MIQHDLKTISKKGEKANPRISAENRRLAFWLSLVLTYIGIYSFIHSFIHSFIPVSYTHLTLPTKRIV